MLNPCVCNQLLTTPDLYVLVRGLARLAMSTSLTEPARYGLAQTVEIVRGQLLDKLSRLDQELLNLRSFFL